MINTLYGSRFDLKDKLKVINSQIFIEEILSSDWDMVKQCYVYNIYRRKFFQILFRIENFFKINDLKICYLRYHNICQESFRFEKGSRVVMCELHDISSVYYYSLSQIINPNFRPVYGIDLRFESLIKNTVFITFL